LATPASAVASWGVEDRCDGATVVRVGTGRHRRRQAVSVSLLPVAQPAPEPTPQRLAAIRGQMSLLSDYL
jgi:hypothetical protein